MPQKGWRRPNFQLRHEAPMRIEMLGGAAALLRTICLAAACVATAACDVFSVTYDITSDPPGATVAVDPPGANVVANGVDRGVTPLSVIWAYHFRRPTGRVITLRKDGYKPKRASLGPGPFRKDATRKRHYELEPDTSTWRITSDPSGASVTVGGALKGVTPTEFTYQNPVDLVMVLRKEGYADISEPLATLEGAETRRHYMLKPLSFVQAMEPQWASVQVRDGLDAKGAWDAVLDVLIRKFDLERLETLSRENGYMRTSWLYPQSAWSDSLEGAIYRLRATVKFSPEHDRVDVKTEAAFYDSSRKWVPGSETSLLQELKTDLMGAVGRVTR